MSHPEALAAKPPWHASITIDLEYLRRKGQVAPEDAQRLLRVIRAAEVEDIPAPRVASYGEGTVGAWWQTKTRAVAIGISCGEILIGACKVPQKGKPPGEYIDSLPGSPEADIPRLRFYLEWIFPGRACGNPRHIVEHECSRGGLR